jgi:predicted DNA-binding transcriptional regulator YafY
VSQAKTERLVNLTMALMATPRLLTVAELGRLVEGYDPDDSPTGGDAFRRKFERDKEELRELGIPLQTGYVDPLAEDEIGYRIARADYALPDIALEPDEAAALGLAARLWSSTQLSTTANSALRKLAATGADPQPPPDLDVQLEVGEASFDPLFDAVSNRQEVTFEYRRPGAEPMNRRLQPWGLVSWHGHWYVGGYDLDRDAPRVFRLSRVRGRVQTVGKAGAYEVPPGFEVRAMVDAEAPHDQRPARQATVRLAPGTSHRLRATGNPVDGEPNVFDLEFVSLSGFAEVLAGHGPNVVVLEPPDLRDAVVERLRALAGTR